LGVENAEFELEGVKPDQPLVDVPQTELWPVMYDVDDDGKVFFSDFASFAAVFQQPCGNEGPPGAWGCDFDHDYKVFFRDFSYFAPNFGKSAQGGEPIAYPPNFPSQWQPSPLRVAPVQKYEGRRTKDEDSIGGALTNSAAAVVTQQQLNRVVSEAVARIEVAEGEVAAALLDGVDYQIVDLTGELLGQVVGSSLVQIDVNAAGFSWFVDATPWDDVEFAMPSGAYESAALPETPAAERADLLSVILHELGHVLGYDHSDKGSVMDELLPLGTRRVWDEESPLDDAIEIHGAFDAPALTPTTVDDYFATT
jgi:hypothetical protein